MSLLQIAWFVLASLYVVMSIAFVRLRRQFKKQQALYEALVAIREARDERDPIWETDLGEFCEQLAPRLVARMAHWFEDAGESGEPFLHARREP